MEVSCRAISDMFDQIKVTTDKHSKELQGLRHTVSTPCKADNKVRVLQKFLDMLQAKNDVLVNSVTELKWRSMKNNLVFSGLREEDGEDTEAVLREFLSVELGISRVELGNVHRFGKFIIGKHRHIVARFLYNRDRSNVLGNSRKLSGTTFYINEQFPTEIEEKRRELYPKLKELRREGHRVKLVRDKLIVDGHLYTEDVVTEDKPREAPNGRITVNEVTLLVLDQRTTLAEDIVVPLDLLIGLVITELKNVWIHDQWDRDLVNPESLPLLSAVDFLG
ncbi:uncharacterized protein [Argopecten irradians]|uniref:uncharacterized protein n=1 Tax=Argopecten irradians TaxID=31199 RepID=UPI00371C7C19